MPTKIPGIEYKSEVKIAGPEVTLLPETIEQEMHDMATNTGFDNTPANEASPAVDNIIVG